MADSLAAIVLAAGAGARLRPLTRFRPKPLCPVGDETLLDGNLRRVAAVVGSGRSNLAVNAHHQPELLAAELEGRAHLSIEEPEALGTAGAVAHLRPWLDGRPALVVNGDSWSTIDLPPLVDGWDGRQVRVLVVLGPESGGTGPIRHRERAASRAPALVDGVRILGSLLPADVVARLPHRPAGLYEACWRPLRDRGELEVVGADGPFVACDRPADYLAANLTWSGGASVVGAGAVVEGELLRSVVWPGGVVRPGERLDDAIRIGDRTTVLVR